MQKLNSRLLCGLSVYLLCTIGIAHGEKLKLHGFVAQGLIQAKDSNFISDEGEISAELTEVGINASYRLSPTLRVAGQGVYLNGGNRYPEGARIDYFFLDWQIVSSLNWQINMNLGRYKNYHWLYSATRDVPHTMPSVILPQSVYFDIFRDVALGSDGVSLLAQTSNSLGDWDIKWSLGSSNISKGQSANLLTNAAKGELKQDYEHQFSLSFTPRKSDLVVGISLLDSDFTYNGAKSDTLTDGKVTTQRLMLNFAYSKEYWELSSELLREKVNFQDLLFSGFISSSTAEGGYIQGRYFLDSSITLLARLDLFDLDSKDRNGYQRQLASGGSIPAYFAYMDQATIGASWDFSANWKLRGEFHRIKGAGRLAPVLDPNVILNNHKYWNMWAIQLMYWF